MLEVASRLREIEESEHGEKLIDTYAYYGLSEDDRSFYQNHDFTVYQGKVRELLRRGEQLFVFHTDRLSAFDRYIGMVPYKGLILSEMSSFWLEDAKKVVPTHLIKAMNERVLEVKNCQPIKAEVIVRGYMAGSMMRAYEKGERQFCGQTLGEGLRAYRSLPQALITPTSKAAAFEHDVDASPEELFAQGVCSETEWRQIEKLSLDLFAYGQEVYAKKGWILVDTKYEFGRLPNGDIIVIDEIHTPDSSRLWIKETYAKRLEEKQAPDMLDKENVRRYLLERDFSGHGEVPAVPAAVLVSLAKIYLQVAETLMEKPLTCHSSDFRIPV
ncbi:MAG: phosphoribosylaminoimidazolesuccinocarboxamide synthase [Oligoflexus sp.]